MVTIKGFKLRDFGSSSIIDPFNMYSCGFNGILPQTHSEEILKSLNITNEKPPAYKYPYWGERQIIDYWNHNMDKKSHPDLCLA